MLSKDEVRGTFGSATHLPAEIIACVQRALEEDIGPGDATTNSIFSPDAQMRGQIIAKQAGVVAGLDVACAAFELLMPPRPGGERVGLALSEAEGVREEPVRFVALVPEGACVENRQMLAQVSGPARALLTAERTALNLLGRMSGIATLTRQFADAVAGTRAVILDTRKTAPGLRAVDKLAVRRGGGQNHRIGLYDMILIKDNHIDHAGGIVQAVQRVRAANTGLEIEVEVRTLQDVRVALELGVQRILLDNMTLDAMRQAVALNAGRAKLEASGNVTLDNVRQIAETGVDYISSGALTHSAKVLDVSFLWVEDRESGK